MFNAVEVASLFGTLELRDTATNTLRQFDSGLENTVNNMRRVGGELQGLGMAISAAVAPLVAFGAQGVRTAMTFDSAMAQISARTGVVGEDLEQVRQLALQMGADTVFSAQDAADAMLELLASGQTVEQMMSTLPSVLTAAAASGEDLGTTADNITNILASFQLGVEDSAAVVDALSRAAGASSADIGSLADGFANVGGVAAQFGLSVEQTAAMLAIFAENGIKGAEAGTQLKSMLLNMARRTENTATAWRMFGTSLYEANGDLRPIPRVLEDIERAARNMTDEDRQQAFQELAGSFGVVGLTALTSSIDMETMLNAMDESADAASVAEARMNTFEGAMSSLGGSIETLQISVFTPFMNNTLRPLVQQITEVVNAINTWAQANPEAVQSIINVVLAVAGLGAGLLGLGTVINFAATAIGGISALFTLLTGPIGLVVAAIAALAVAFATNFGGIRDLVSSIVAGLQVDFSLILFYAQYYIGSIWEGVRPALEMLQYWFVMKLAPALSDTFNNHIMPVVRDFQTFLSGLWKIVEPHLQNLYNWFMTEGLPGVLNFITDQVIPRFNDFIDLIRSIWKAVSPGLLDLADWFLNTGLPGVQTIVENFGVQFRGLVRILEKIWDNVSPGLTLLAAWFGSQFKAIVTLIEHATGGVGELQKAFNGLELPWWMSGTGIGARISQGLFEAGSGPNIQAPDPMTAWQPKTMVSGTSTKGGSGTPFINAGTAFMGGGTALPMRAGGGPVMENQPYVVGERGPEVFVPGSSGSIVANGRMGGVQIGNLTVQYNAMNGGQQDYEGFVAFLERVAAG